MIPEEIIYSSAIKEARAKLPEPDTISAKYFVTGVFVPEPFPSLDFIRLVEFQKITLDNGKLVWEFKSIT